MLHENEARAHTNTHTNPNLKKHVCTQRPFWRERALQAIITFCYSLWVIGISGKRQCVSVCVCVHQQCAAWALCMPHKVYQSEIGADRELWELQKWPGFNKKKKQFKTNLSSTWCWQTTQCHVNHDKNAHDVGCHLISHEISCDFL